MEGMKGMKRVGVRFFGGEVRTSPPPLSETERGESR
jgi:hypothetical protein